MESARFLGRQLSDLSAEWNLARTSLGQGRFAFTEFVASLYDGRLTGESEILFDPDRASYSLAAMVHDVQLAPFIRDGADSAAATSDDNEDTGVRGRLYANLNLAGDFGDRAR